MLLPRDALGPCYTVAVGEGMGENVEGEREREREKEKEEEEASEESERSLLLGIVFFLPFVLRICSFLLLLLPRIVIL